MKYAIVESGGKQYRAVEGGTLEVDRLPLEPGANIKLEQVLLLADGEDITVGMPLVKASPVWTKVLEHFKGEKVTIFNYSPKKRIRVKTGHRQNYTRLLVEQIGGSELMPKKEPVKAAEAVVEEAKVETKKTTKPAPAKTGTKKTTKPAPAKTEAKKATKAAKPAPAKAKPTASPKGKTATKPASKKTEPAKKTTKTSPAKPTKKPAKKTATK
jgi:large subunit ribosomal protein L21